MIRPYIVIIIITDGYKLPKYESAGGSISSASASDSAIEASSGSHDKTSKHQSMHMVYTCTYSAYTLVIKATFYEVNRGTTNPA